MPDDIRALRSLILDSGKSIPEIAKAGKVNERSLRRWFYGHTEKLNFVTASSVHHALTGKPFIEVAKPSRKRRAA